MAIDVTDTTFESEVVARSQTVLVIGDLWAPWCGPCLSLGPIIEKVVDETNGQAVLAKVNIHENPQAAAAFRVQSSPAVFALRNGQIVSNFMGAQGEDAVRKFVAAVLPSETEQ